MSKQANLAAPRIVGPVAGVSSLAQNDALLTQLMPIVKKLSDEATAAGWEPFVFAAVLHSLGVELMCSSRGVGLSLLMMKASIRGLKEGETFLGMTEGPRH